MVVSNVAGVALTTSSLFLLVVAIALNSPHLFYMSTAMIVTIGAARLQAFLAVRNLKIVRKAPSEVQVGQWAQVELCIESGRNIRRPLITVWDHLPPRLVNETITPSTPIAPGADGPVSSTYRFKPTRRGHYKWSKVSVVGTDALGLISTVKEYSANIADLTVLPAPIPVPFDVSSASGWGNSEAEHGLSRGTGIEPRGIREYVSGDSMRYVHWRSTARTGQLVVKEFETGSNAALAFVVQNTKGTEIGEGSRTTLELMCGHLAHICSRILRQGVRVQFPVTEPDAGSILPHERELEVLRGLAVLMGDSPLSVAVELQKARKALLPGATVHVLLAVADPNLPAAIVDLRRHGHAVACMVYDAAAFPSKRRIAAADSAVHPRYMDQLRAAGALVREMPLEGLGK